MWQTIADAAAEVYLNETHLPHHLEMLGLQAHIHNIDNNYSNILNKIYNTAIEAWNLKRIGNGCCIK